MQEMSRWIGGNLRARDHPIAGVLANHMRLMSTATKRGKLLPDLLVGRDAVTPSLADEPANGRSASYAGLDASARSRPSILNWILVKRSDLARDLTKVMNGRASAPPEPKQRADDAKPGQRRVAAAADPAARTTPDTIFYAKGDATPAAARPWRWDCDDLAESSLKRAPCVRRGKAKARRNAP
jgi:hypothetical protein